MSFCPHCGKSVAEQAIKCLSCGGDLEGRGKAARFKGTMIMQPTAAAPVAPASAPEPTPAPAPAPVAAAAPAVSQGAKPAPSKVAKHTMLGTGGPGLSPALLAGLQKAGIAAPAAPPPPAGPTSVAPTPPQAGDPALASTGPSAPAISAPVAVRAPAREDSQRTRNAPRGESRDAGDSDPPNVVPGASSTPAIVLGVVGIVVIALAGYIIARLLGVV